MNKFVGDECPICKEKFKETDEIAVCPECGAPYHRNCIAKEGSCVRTDLHEAGQHWQSASEKKSEEQDQLLEHIRVQGNVCPRCGAQNGMDVRFCNICGTALDNNQPENAPPPPFPPRQEPLHQIPFNPYTTPFGGLSPDEEIDGITAKEYAAFTGKNSHYYLPKFKMMEEKKQVMNFAAFFFNGIFFLYRKMYGMGVLLLMLYIVMDIPSLLVNYTALCTAYEITSPFQFDLGRMTMLAGFCSFLRIAIMVGASFFANRLYKGHAAASIRRIKAKNLPENDYYAALASKGSVNMVLIMVLLSLYLLVSFGASAYVLMNLL